MATESTILRLGPADHGRLVSSEEFAEADFEGAWTYEREAGRLVVMPPDGQGHILGSVSWWKLLAVYWATYEEVVEFVVSRAWLRMDLTKDRIGDIGVYLVGDPSPPPIPDRVPELMIEVVSPGKKSHDRDYVTKRAEYHRLGVLEYVISDRHLRRVTVLTREPGDYAERILVEGDVYTSPLLPGLAIPIGEIL